MTYVVTESCIKCKYTDCVDVCPVDCFYEGENMLVIDPEICIDCGVCEPECPAGAISPDTQEGMERWVALNQEFSKLWPKLTKKKPLSPAEKAEADQWLEVPDKFEKYFSQNAGQ